MGIGLKIKELADQKKVDAVWISKHLGKTKQAVYDIYSKEDVNTAIIRKLSGVFNVPVGYFFDEEPATSSIKGNNNLLAGRDNNIHIGKLADCKKEVEHLKELLAEKERTIQILIAQNKER